jgi:hypothetical protein
MLAVAAPMNLSETAFVVVEDTGRSAAVALVHPAGGGRPVRAPDARQHARVVEVGVRSPEDPGVREGDADEQKHHQRSCEHHHHVLRTGRRFCVRGPSSATFASPFHRTPAQWSVGLRVRAELLPSREANPAAATFNPAPESQRPRPRMRTVDGRPTPTAGS